MDEFIQNAHEGKYTEALAWMKVPENKAELLKVIHTDLVDDDDDDDDAFWDYVGIYDLAMDTATEEAGEFASLLKAFIIEACLPDQNLTDHHLFTGYPKRYKKRTTNQYYKYLAETNYVRANEFIRIPANREAVVGMLNDEFEEAGLDIKWQDLYDEILEHRANDTAELLQGIIRDATNRAIILDPHSYVVRRAARMAGRIQQYRNMQAAEEAANAANAANAAAAGAHNNGYESEMTLPPPRPNNNNMGGGRRHAMAGPGLAARRRKTKRRARKTTRRVRKSRRVKKYVQK